MDLKLSMWCVASIIINSSNAIASSIAAIGQQRNTYSLSLNFLNQKIFSLPQNTQNLSRSFRSWSMRPTRNMMAKRVCVGAKRKTWNVEKTKTRISRSGFCDTFVRCKIRKMNTFTLASCDLICNNIVRCCHD